MNKLALIITQILLTGQVFASNSLEVGYGKGELEGESVKSTTIQYTYTPKNTKKMFGGKLGYSLGVRSTFYKADLFQAADNNSEFLEDLDVSSHNIFGQIQYQYDIFQIGFNLDLIGISSSSSSKVQGSTTEVKNETFNAFLFAKNDKGSLNSQFFFLLDLNPVVIKAGLAHSLITFENTGLSDDDNRQRFFNTIFGTLGYMF